MKKLVAAIALALVALFFSWKPDLFWKAVDLLHFMFKVIVLGK